MAPRNLDLQVVVGEKVGNIRGGGGQNPVPSFSVESKICRRESCMWEARSHHWDGHHFRKRTIRQESCGS